LEESEKRTNAISQKSVAKSEFIFPSKKVMVPLEKIL